MLKITILYNRGSPPSDIFIGIRIKRQEMTHKIMLKIIEKVLLLTECENKSKLNILVHAGISPQNWETEIHFSSTES